MMLGRKWQLCLLGLMLCIAQVRSVDEEPTVETEATEENVETPADENEEVKEEAPVPVLPPLELDEDVACAACEAVVDRLYAHIQNVSSDAKDQPMKARKEIATTILRSACYQTRGMTLEGVPGSRKFKYPKSAYKSDKTDDSDASDDDASSEDADVVDEVEDEVELVEGEIDQLLYKACYYMMSTEGWKLRSRIAGFYKETTSYSLQKRLCHNSLKLCAPPTAAKLKRTEKCLTAAFSAIGKEDWKTATAKAGCAQGDPSSSGKKRKKKGKKSKKSKKASEDEASSDSESPKDSSEEG